MVAAGDRIVEVGMNERDPMKLIRLSDLAGMLGAELTGQGPDLIVTGMAALDRAGPDQISFLTNPKYRHLVGQTRAGAVLVSNDYSDKAACRLLKVKDPYLALARLTALFYPPVLPHAGIHPTAIIDPETSVADTASVGAHSVLEKGVRIGDHTAIFPGVFVGRDSVIGSNCIVYPNVTIYHGVNIGNSVIIHAGSVIGSDGFGYARDGNRYVKVPQIGGIVIEDDVEIGANCTLDRGSMGVTRIGRGVKLDNLVHVAHNVGIGADTAIAAQSGIAGSTTIGNRVTMAGQVGVAGHLVVGDDVVLTARAVAVKSVPEKTMLSGYPPLPHREWMRNQIALRNIHKLEEALKQLSQKVEQLNELHTSSNEPGKESSGD